MSDYRSQQPSHELVALVERALADSRAREGRGSTAAVGPGGSASNGAGAGACDGLWDKAFLAPLREFLGRPGKGFRSQLVRTAWVVAGGEPNELPIELPLAIEVLHSGSLIVDDIQDQSDERRGRPALHRLYGVPVALNTGNWMYFWALDLMTRALPDTRALAIQRAAVAALMRCHQGQALDLATRVYDVSRSDMTEVVAMATGLKTGSLMELAATLGAVGAGCDGERCEVLGRFGYDLGVGLQMLDDLGGLVSPARRAKGLEDLSMARPTWPWAWLSELAGPIEFSRLQERARELTLENGASSTSEAAHALADELAESIADVARERIRGHLTRALALLRRSLDLPGSTASQPVVEAMEQLEGEVARLEKSYG